MPETPNYSKQFFYEDSVWSDMLTGTATVYYNSPNAYAAAESVGRGLAPAAENSTDYTLAKRLLGDNIQAVDLSANTLFGKRNDGISAYSVTDNRTEIVSDEIGNPVNIDGLEYRWNGRQLQSVYVDENNYINYSYNTDGQRVKKEIHFAESGWYYTYEYYYNGTILAGQKVTSVENGVETTYTLTFMYDNNGDIFGFFYNDTPYYYVKNAQNDVILIMDADGQVVVLYQYDAWGTITQCFDGTENYLATINPILYRSYYMDFEIEMYYLNSRYYVPYLCRFLNADDADVLEEDQDSMIEENLFAYCLNNPVNMADDDGTVAWWIAAAVTGAAWDAAFYCVEAAITGNFSWKGLGKAALKGAVTGLAFGAVGKLAGKAVKAVKTARSIKNVNGATKASKSCSKLFLTSKKIAKYKKFTENTNKIHHFFGKGQHGFDRLLKKFNNEKAAYNAIYNAVFKKVQAKGITGQFELVVKVKNINVTVRGRVIDGVVRIGTGFIRRPAMKSQEKIKFEKRKGY